MIKVPHLVWLLTACNVLVGSLSLQSDPAYADEGQLINHTPFDYKLARTGIEFSTRSMPHPETQADPTKLFYTARSFRYVKDLKGDRWQSPSETEARRSGDCEDKAIWLFYRLKSAGVQDVRLVIGKFKVYKKEFHVWVTYRDASGALCLADPTLQKRIWSASDFGDGFYRASFSYDGSHRYFHSRD